MANVDGILGQLVERARKPLREASGIPPEAYRSPELFALERELIFAKDWLCPGRAADIPKPGDYITFSINDQPIFVIRGEDGTIRGFSNVCLHRMMRLLDGTGNRRRIACPYHAWTYALDGRLLSAPHMKDAAGFEAKSLSLPDIRTELWEGWIYVTLNPEARSIATELSPLREVVAKYAMADYVPAVTQDHVWNTNWKLLSENFMEGYHLPIAHRTTVGAWFPEEDTLFPDETYDLFTYQTFTKSESARYGRAHPSNSRLEGRWRYTTVMPTVFPTHMYILAPDHLWYLSLRPRAVGEIDVRFGMALAPEVASAVPDVESFTREMVAFFESVNDEDRVVVEAIYRNTHAPLARPGRLSWLEREIHDFIGYLARRLAGSTARGAAVRIAS